jgi:hypothetical protein
MEIIMMNKRNIKTGLESIFHPKGLGTFLMAGVLAGLSAGTVCLGAEEESLDEVLNVMAKANAANAADAADAADAAEGAAREHPLHATLPTLAHRGLGEDVVLNKDGSEKEWGHTFPIYGQKVLNLGIDFPQPYGISGIGSWIKQEINLNHLSVLKDGSYQSVDDFVKFSPITAETYALEAKADFWLFPFWNIFGIAGVLDGKATVPLDVNVLGALEFLDVPIPPRLEDKFDKNIPLTAHPEYTGVNYGVGSVFAMGWKSYFVAVPVTYVYSDLSNLDSTISTFTAEILLGHMFNLVHPDQQLELFVGAGYLDAGFKMKDSVMLPLSEVDPSLEDQEIDYIIDEENADKWNFIVGGQFQVSKAWSLQAQIGMLGSREQLTFVGNYRW